MCLLWIVLDECFWVMVVSSNVFLRNAFDISRDNLLDQITRMRSNLLRTSHSAQLFADQGARYLFYCVLSVCVYDVRVCVLLGDVCHFLFL